MPHGEEPGRTADISLKALLIAGSLSLLALWWAWPRLQRDQSFHAESSHLVRFEPKVLPDFELQGSFAPLKRQQLLGQWTLLVFAYARCTADCPTLLGTLANTRRMMLTADLWRNLRVVIVSVDDEDDAPRIQDYAARFDPTFMGYAGAWEEREKLFLFFDADVEATLERGAEQAAHAVQFYLIDPDAHFVAAWNRIPEATRLQGDLCSFINCTH